MKNVVGNILMKDKFFLMLLTILGIWHLWSLVYSPIPWHDETFYASITKSLIEGNGFTLEVWPFKMEGKEVLIYGPLYFIFTGVSFLVFGFGIFQFRIVALLFTALSIYVFYNILKKLDISKSISRLLIVMLVFDVIVIQNSHSGRMDMVALFLGLVAWYAYFKGQFHNKYILWMALSGVAAVLTTPRIAVIVFPLFIITLIQLIKSKNWTQAAILIGPPVILYSGWIFYAFGSIVSFIKYYTTTTSQSISFLSYLGGNLYIPFYQFPLILTALVSVVILIVKKNKLNTLFLLSLPILSFYIIVDDTGVYSALILFFWYLIIALGLSTDGSDNKIFKTLLNSWIMITLFLNISIFCLKAVTIIGTQSERDPIPLQAWVNEHIPKESKIVGEEQFYYSCIKNGCNYQYLKGFNSHSEIAKYHLEHYQPDFLFISTQTSKELLEAYNQKFLFVEKWNYIPPRVNSNISKLLKLLPVSIQSSYEGTLIQIEPIVEDN